ncbi:MAG: Holliday junction branch migration protein RuvA [Chloroflexota bacterium]|nr:Holliday junction branch migration protein RuvA [Chloroflexota bacterium]
MIATLEGTLQYRGVDSIIVGVGGVGFRVYVSVSTLSQLRDIDNKVFLYTYLHVKEDNLSLYGFASSQEVKLFKNLISVSGVGPKLALALLSSLSVEQLTMAILSGNIDIIDQVPGVGKKVASRITVELKGKLEQEWEGEILPLAEEDSNVVAALTGLGYSLREATQVVSTLPSSSDLSLEDKIKMALSQLAAR